MINDVPTWKLEKDGAYTVRSAYKDIMNHNVATLQHRAPGTGIVFGSINCHQRYIKN